MGHVGRLGVIVGLPQEAAILRQALGTRTPLLVCAGARPEQAVQAAAELVAGGAQALVSFGLAGALDPALSPGDIVLADRVIAPDGTSHPTDAALRRRLATALTTASCRWRSGPIAGVDAVVPSARAKGALAARTGALAVDMESHAVAGASRGLPFAVLRVVVDPAERALPSSALAALSRTGTIRILPLMAGLLQRPREIRELWRLAGDSKRARSGLRRAALVLGAACRLM